MKNRICIVGGGIIGMLIARELIDSGEKVVIIERGETGKASSWAGGGILSPLYPWRYPDSVSELAKWSQVAYPGLISNLQKNTGIDSEWVRSGLLTVDAEDGEKAVKWGLKYANSMKLVDPDYCETLQPGLVVDGGPIAWMPDVAQVRNPRLLAALKRNLLNNGVEIREQQEITDFGTSNGKIHSILTNTEEIEADRCIIAAGAWSGHLLSRLGLDIPVKPIRGQMLVFRHNPAGLGRVVLKENYYLIPRRDGRILVGSTLEDVGFDNSTTESAAVELRQAAVSIMPALAKIEVELQWAGLRPGSPDDIPYIGPHPEIEGLFACTGHFRNGFVLGPASARLLVDLVLGRPPLVNPAPYRLIRNTLPA
ncbi:MAG: glycine oxidase ThiO [Acidiferrobacterales bacterium]